MPYHPLAQQDGLTPEQRRSKASDICEKLMPYFGQLSDREQAFVEQMSSMSDDDSFFPSPKQCWWLVDIAERFL